MSAINPISTVETQSSTIPFVGPFFLPTTDLRRSLINIEPVVVPTDPTIDTGPTTGNVLDKKNSDHFSPRSLIDIVTNFTNSVTPVDSGNQRLVVAINPLPKNPSALQVSELTTGRLNEILSPSFNPNLNVAVPVVDILGLPVPDIGHNPNELDILSSVLFMNGVVIPEPVPAARIPGLQATQTPENIPNPLQIPVSVIGIPGERDLAALMAAQQQQQLLQQAQLQNILNIGGTNSLNGFASAPGINTSGSLFGGAVGGVNPASLFSSTPNFSSAGSTTATPQGGGISGATDALAILEQMARMNQMMQWLTAQMQAMMGMLGGANPFQASL
ncbi:MAG: hypothetical protein AB7P76_11460 [Candidatus Melainabacteria bacterium]